MLTNPPPVYRKRNRPSEKRVALPSPVAISVVSVSVIDGTGSLWTFSGPVSVTDGVPCPQLRIFVNGEWLTGASVGGWSENAVACDFGTGDLTAGLMWEIVERPTAIDFGAAVLTLPQSGLLIGSEQ